MVNRRARSALLNLPLNPIKRRHLSGFGNVILKVRVVRTLVRLRSITRWVVGTVNFLVFSNVDGIVGPNTTRVATLNPTS